MTTQDIIVLAALGLGIFLFFNHDKNMSKGESISPATTAAKADEMGFVDTANPQPEAIASNNPFGSAQKGFVIPSQRGLLAPKIGSFIGGSTAGGMMPRVASPITNYKDTVSSDTLGSSWNNGGKTFGNTGIKI
jgi:hypothetical protein